MTQKFKSQGKLLLTAEYMVLDGATALAIPCKFGQDLSVTTTNTGLIEWEAFTLTGAIWASFSFKLKAIDKWPQKSSEKPQQAIKQLLAAAKMLAPSFLENSKGVKIETHLEFAQNWGLGSSSTLIFNIAQWAEVNPFELLQKSMGGSGYDIACAGARQPILYKRDVKAFHPTINSLTLSKEISNNILFVHLNIKQNSRAGIAHYETQKKNKHTSWESTFKKIEQLSLAMSASNHIEAFSLAVEKHEMVMSKFLNMKPVKSLYFSDFKGNIKSLGAWGGDFIMAVSETCSVEEMKYYFKEKGYPTTLTYKEMVG